MSKSRALSKLKIGTAALALTATMGLASCAEESSQGNTQDGGAAQGGSTMAGTTMDDATTGGSTMGGMAGGTTMSGTTMGGTTMGGMVGGTTMAGTTMGSSTMGGTMAGGAITSAQDLFVQNPGSLVGREVNISEANVQGVVGDSTFFVGSSPNSTILASLEGERSGSQAEQAVNIEEGQTVRINGTVEQLPSTRGLQRFGLNQSEIQALDNQEIYLSLSQAEVAGQ